MINRNFLIALYCTVLAFAVLYIPQTILPLLAEIYSSDMSTAILLISVTLLPAGLAPLFYGYLLEHISAKSLLQWGFLLLSFTFVLMFFVTSMNQLIWVRFLQGLILPAIITSLMTYSAISAPKNQVRRYMSIYIATTIVGGFLGRAITGLLVDYAGWNYTLSFWAILIVIGLFLLSKINTDAEANFSKPKLDVIKKVIMRPGYGQIYLIVFLKFFIFASVLNALPFRLKEIDPNITETAISMMYVAYLMGAIISFNITRILKIVGSDMNALLLGLVFYVVGTALFVFSNTVMLFVAMLAFCSGMFFIHATLSGLVNHLSANNHGVINGLYLSSYYMGGALGSVIPGIIYSAYGWNEMIYGLLITLVLIGILLSILHFKKLLHASDVSLE